MKPLSANRKQRTMNKVGRAKRQIKGLHAFNII
jgi:hypothetical protein